MPESAALRDPTSQAQTQRDFKSWKDLSQVNQTQLGQLDCDNIRTEKTVSPVSIRHSKHKQPMMYVARFSKQTQAKQKIKASKIEKQRLHQASMSHTERQYTLPQRHQLQITRSGLTYEQLAAKLLAQDSVEIIDASYNQITQIPHLEMSNHCHFLIEINLSHNAIKEIPEETFRSIQLLEMVNLAANELRKLPESLFSLQKLISLDVSTNKITLLQPKVSLLKSLKMLLVEGNPLQRLPNSIGYLSDLEQISCDIFFYLAAQPRESTRVKNGENKQPTAYEWPQQRQLLVKDQLDYRLAKLMQIMQTSKKSNSAFLELAYAFQFQRPTQHEFFDFDSDREMEQMEELLSVNNFGFAGSLLHCVAANNHAHLIEETVRYLQAIFGSDLGGQKQLRLQSILRTAINAKNSFDQTPLDVTITYQFEESAEEILTLLGHFIDIEFRQIADKPYAKPRKGSVELSSATQNESFVASNDQSAFMKPGNQQSELIPFQPNPSRGNTLNQSLLQPIAMPTNQNYQVLEGVQTQSFLDNNDKTLDEAEEQTYGVHPCIEIDRDPHPKMHPLVVTLANANFGVSYKLLETMHLTFQRKFANYQQLNKVEGNLFSTSLYRHCYDLNCVDPDGLSFLHHLFANFSRQHEKATKVFKLMLTQTQQIKNPSLFPARFTISSPHEIHDAQKELPPPYKSLLLNQVTNFGETPFVLAIEHQQNSAVDFAVSFNIQQLQNYLAQLRSQLSDSQNLNEQTSFWNTPQAKMARNKKLRIQLDILRSPSPKSLSRESSMFNQVFDLTETKNMREITPIHRAVIKSNYAAVNSMLQSAITIRRMLQERIETPSESKMLLSYVPRSILDQILVDVFRIDNSGKTPREHALKMVFMSKILRQAESSQIWSAISLQSSSHRLNPLLKPEAHTEFSVLSAVNKPSKIRHQVRYGHHLNRLFIATNRKGSVNDIEIRASQKGDDMAITSRTTYDSEQRACSKGVKKAKSMAFNTIQYRAESSQLTSASQLMLSQRMRVPSQVSKPNQPPEDNDYPSSQKKKALQIDTNNEAALHFSKFAPQFELKLASAQNIQQVRRFESPVQNELKAMAPAQLNNSNTSNTQTYRSLMNLVTAKGGLPTIQRIAINAAEEKDFSITASSVIKNQRKQLAKAEADAKNSDIMCLEELEDSRLHAKTGGMRQKPNKTRKTQIEETIEGFNVGDSSCDEDFTALPSIQNEYTLQIKSFYQYKKPYIQQLQSNQFESDFYTILGEMNPCAKKSGPYGLHTDRQTQPEQKPEQSAFAKVECLYSIVQRATNASKLQDAKDVLDFLHYEIENQVQTPCKLTAATGLAALNSNSGFKALDSTSSRNSSLYFLKGEVKHLRAQLDLLSKHMISVPWGAKVYFQCSDKESDYSSNELTPVETPNINECSSSAHAFDEAEAEDESVIECQEIRIAVGRQAKQDTVDITDFEDCSEKIPFGDGVRLSLTKENHRAEALLRNTAKRSPGHAAIELKKTPQRLPSASQYVPQAVSRFQHKRKSDYGYQARPDMSKQSSVHASLNSAVVPNTTRASFAPGSNLESTTKANKLAFLLDPTALKSFAQSQMNGPRPMFENVETEEGATTKNRPLASNGLLSFSLINKDLQTVKTQMNSGDKLSSATEHESCQNFNVNREQTINEAVLEEIPISVNKLPVKVSAMTALPGSFTDRQSQVRSFREIQIDKQLGTPYLNQDQLEVDEIVGSQSDKQKALNKYAQSILIEASEANSNALGLVRRHAAASRMSERYQQANIGQKFAADETRMSMRTFPNPDMDSLMINAMDQMSETSPCMAQHSAKQLIILLGEDQSEMAIDTNNYDSNYSSTKKIGPKKLHQTTVVMPAGFSVMQEKGKSKRESSIMHAQPQFKQKQRKKPSKTIAAPPLMRKDTETSTKNVKLDLGKQQSDQLRNSAVLPPKNGIINQTLSTLIAQKYKQPQQYRPHQDSSNQKMGQANSRLSVVDAQSQKVIKITLGSIPTTETGRQQNQSDIASQSSGLFGPAKKQFTGMITQKSVNTPDQRRGVKSLKPRNTAPAFKPTIKLQMPKHNAKNEPFYQNPRSPMISGPMPAKISIGQRREHHFPAYADIARQKTIDLKRPPHDFSLERRSDTESNKSGAVMTIQLNSFCPAKLTGQPKKKNQRAQGTESVLFGTGANSSEHAKNVSNKKV